MIKVIEARANDDFSLEIRFSDGKIKRFDARPYLERGVFRELKAPAKFKSIKVVYGTVQWEGEQDISPETLYLEGIEINQ